jgi:serine/threonine protein kinase
MRVEVACRITLDVCEGLAYAHQACDHAGRPLEIVHRDISPHNVLMTRHGEVKLVDFGLAKASSHLSAEDEDIVKGKFGYLAPEVTLGHKADKRVDIFAAGILLWEMLTGRRLFKGETDVETFKLVRAAQIVDPRHYRKDVPDVVRAREGARARSNQRYQTADGRARSQHGAGAAQASVNYLDIAERVKQAAAGRRWRKRPPRPDRRDRRSDHRHAHDFSGDTEAVSQRCSAAGLRAKSASDRASEIRVAVRRRFHRSLRAAGAAGSTPAAPRARMRNRPRKRGPFWRWFRLSSLLSAMIAQPSR